LQFASQEAPASGHRQSRPAGTQGRSLFSFEWEAGFTAFRHGSINRITRILYDVQLPDTKLSRLQRIRLRWF
jgi:hypothetical protein